MKIEITRTTPVSSTVRSRQLRSGFDVPFTDAQKLTWRVDAPIEDRDWSIGLIVGPSGSGKSTILTEAFGTPAEFTWDAPGVVDDFPDDLSVNDIIAACSAVGFNTIPAWLRPHAVLSNGEKFRVDIARRMLETPADETILVDEFTSVVDRQVARITAHAVAKWCRRNGRKLVVATCHYDVEDWLQPDWVIEPSPSHADDDDKTDASTFRWRSVQSRPSVVTELHAAPWAAWPLFAPYHYLTANLHRGARCYVLTASIDGAPPTPAAFGGVLQRPVNDGSVVYGLSRLVTLPDWQGLGLAFVLTDQIAAAYTKLGYPFHTYPAHPALIRSFDASPNWRLFQKPKVVGRSKTSKIQSWAMGSRPNAVFRYCGPTDHITEAEARAIVSAGKAMPRPQRPRKRPTRR